MASLCHGITSNLCSFSLLLHISTVSITYGHIVRVKQGLLTGQINIARNGLLFNSYFGIPYAQPPVGKLRLEPPQEAQPWTGVWNASKIPEECYQIKRNSDEFIGSEDCLYLNVHTPMSSQSGDNWPVIFFIHGGSFKTGSNKKEGPEYIMSLGNIILVQPNYRLGIFGLLSTGDDVLPGNMALKDQVSALKWTNQNIFAFGGDPNRITIAGHSSGAICVHAHTYSPLSKGLFQRAIIMSMAALYTNWISTQTQAKSIAQELAQIAGCGYNSSKKIKECFLEMDKNNVLKIQQKFKISEFDVSSPLHIVLENKKIKDAFFPEDAIKTGYTSTSIQWMIGYTTSESGQDVARYLSDGCPWCQSFNENFRKYIPIIYGYLWNTKLSYINFITETIKTHYFGSETMGPNTDIAWVDMSSNVGTRSPIMKAIHSYNGTRFVYLYDYKSNFSTQLNKYSYEKYLGVCHVDDLQLLFKRNESQDSLSLQDISFGHEILRRWVNFAHSGNPNEPYPIDTKVFGFWKPVKTQRIEYLRMKLKGTMETNLDHESYEFLSALPWYSDLY